MTTMTIQTRDEFENTTKGFIGVVQKDPKGNMVGQSVRPGETVLLDEDEQIATANAPKRDEDNPLSNGSLKKIREASDMKNRRPLAPAEAPAPEAPAAPEVDPEREAALAREREAQERIAAAEKREAEAKQVQAAKERAKREERADVRPETGAAQPPAAPAPAGQAAKAEEVATPSAPQATAPKAE